MTAFDIAIKAVVVFLALLTLVRVSGKRWVAQATSFDFVLALMLGDTVDDMVFGEVPLSQGMVAVGSFIAARCGAAAVSRHFPRVARWLNGEPAIVIRDGHVLTTSLRRELVSDEELDALLRRRGIPRSQRTAVKAAWIECEGDLAVVRRDPPASLA